MSMLHKFWNPTILDWRIRSKFGKETKENQGDQLKQMYQLLYRKTQAVLLETAGN